MNNSKALSPLGRLIGLSRSILPALPQTNREERLRAAVGAGIGILVCAVCTATMEGIYGAGWFLIAPLGATAVLVFAIPNSPLAQPWSAVVGNGVSALVATAVVFLLPPPWAPAVAVGGAIYCMMLVRALHPPGGAVALLATIEADTVHQLGPAFAIVPVAATTVLLVVAAIVYGRATGRVYPFRQPAREARAASGMGLSTHELQDLLTRFNQSANLGVADLGRLFAAAEREAVSHRFDAARCADIMSADLITVAPETPLTRVAWLFQKHAIKSVPVVDRSGAPLGIILQSGLIFALTLGTPLKRSRNPRRLKRPFRDLLAEDAMQDIALPVTPASPVGALIDKLATQEVQVVPVIEAGRLVGVITRSDVMSLLLRSASPDGWTSSGNSAPAALSMSTSMSSPTANR